MLVAEVGYDRMTVEAIATRAGVSKPTIYRRWPGGKKEIVLDAIRSKHADADALPDTGSLRGDLLALFALMVERIDEDAHLAGGACQPAARERGAQHAHARRGRRARARRLGRLLERAVARGELSPDARITPLFHDIAGALIFTRAVITGEPIDRPFLEELVDHVLLPVLNPLPKEN